MRNTLKKMAELTNAELTQGRESTRITETSPYKNNPRFAPNI